MSCEICGCANGRHDSRCPKYDESRKVIAKCEVCDENIYVGEKYIENDDNRCIHYGCEKSLSWLLKWLGYEVKGG